MKGNAPTALNKRGKKIHQDGYTFDSEKKYRFYHRFITNCDYHFAVHPRFKLFDLLQIHHQAKITALAYTPDFIIYDKHQVMLHVYDVKNSFSVYAIDSAAKLRFNLFACQYQIPVEAVVVRTHDFKSIAQCVSKPRSKKNPWIMIGSTARPSRLIKFILFY